MKDLQDYYNACNALLRAFCEKHEFDYDDAKDNWVGNDIGGIVNCGDCFFGMDVIVTDLRENAPKGELLSWYDYTLECGYLGVNGCNYPSWLMGCPVHSEERLEELRQCKKRVEEAKEELKKCIERNNDKF